MNNISAETLLRCCSPYGEIYTYQHDPVPSIQYQCTRSGGYYVVLNENMMVIVHQDQVGVGSVSVPVADVALPASIMDDCDFLLGTCVCGYLTDDCNIRIDNYRWLIMCFGVLANEP